MRSLGLLSVAHAINHVQAVLLPLIFIKIIDEFTVGVDDVAFLVAFGAFAAGAVQLELCRPTRVVSRRGLLGFGGILFGGGMAAQALATNFLTFAVPSVASRIGGSPQHPVGNAILWPTVSRRSAAASPSAPTSRRDRRDRRGAVHRALADRRRRLAGTLGALRGAGDC